MQILAIIVVIYQQKNKDMDDVNALFDYFVTSFLYKCWAYNIYWSYFYSKFSYFHDVLAIVCFDDVHDRLKFFHRLESDEMSS